MKANILKIVDFSGGLNTKTSDTEIADNQCVDILNFEFDPGGDLKKRLGQSLYNSTAISYSGTGATQMYHLKKLYDSDGSTTRFLAWARWHSISGTAQVALYDDNGSGTFSQVNITDLPSYLLTDAQVYTTTMMDRVIFTNGNEVPYWIASTGNAKRLGIVAPTALAVADHDDAGSVADGYYRYRVTFYNTDDGIESAPKTSAAAQASGGGSTMRLTISANGDTHVTKMKVYRTKVKATAELAEADTDFYLVETVDKATSYDDDLADASLGVAYDTDVDDNQPPPTAPTFCAEHHNRLWLIGDSTYPYRLFYSKIGEPDYFPTNNYIDIGRLDADKPMALCVLNDYLWVGSRNGWRKVTASGATTTWSVSSPYIGPGVFSKKSVAVCASMRVPLNPDEGGTVVYGRRGVIMYLSYDGMVVAFDGDRFINVGYVVQDEIGKSTGSVLEDAVGVYYPVKNQYLLSINNVIIIE